MWREISSCWMFSGGVFSDLDGDVRDKRNQRIKQASNGDIPALSSSWDHSCSISALSFSRISMSSAVHGAIDIIFGWKSSKTSDTLALGVVALKQIRWKSELELQLDHPTNFHQHFTWFLFRSACNLLFHHGFGVMMIIVAMGNRFCWQICCIGFKWTAHLEHTIAGRGLMDFGTWVVRFMLCTNLLRMLRMKLLVEAQK